MKSQWHDSIESFFTSLHKIFTAIDVVFGSNPVLIWKRFSVSFGVTNPTTNVQESINMPIRAMADFRILAWFLIELCHKYNVPLKPSKKEPTALLEWIDWILDLFQLLASQSPPIITNEQFTSGEITVMIPCIAPVPFIAKHCGFEASDNFFLLKINNHTNIESLLAALKELHDSIAYYNFHVPKK